jgi:hypothetical protein
MITLPITEQAKQQEWNTIPTVAKSNGFPLQIIRKLKKKIILRKQKIKVTPTQTQQQKNGPSSHTLSTHTQGYQFIQKY